MNWTKIPVATTLAAASIASPATAYADPLPTTDEVVGVLAGLTDPNIPAANKGNIVTPRFNPDETGTIDDHLHRMDAFGGLLPPDFVVTDIQPAPANFAEATVTTTGGYKHGIHPRPIVLVDQGGHWQINHDSAMDVLDAIWKAGQRVPAYGPSI
jgi:hypothetical protein